MGQIDNSTSLSTALNAVFVGARSVSEDHLKVVSRFVGTAPNLRLAAETGIGAPVAWDGASDYEVTTVDTAFASTLEYAAYALEARVPVHRAQESSQIVANMALKLGSETAALRKSLVELKIAGVFSGTSMPGSKPVCSATHPTLVGTRSNYGTSALDATSLAAAVGAFRNWKTYEGTRADRSMARKILMTGLSVYETAVALVQNAMVASASTNAITPTLANRYNIVDVVYNFEMDATDWILVLEDEFAAMAGESGEVSGRLVSPIVMWDREAPYFDAGVDPHNGAPWVAVRFALATGFGPVPENIYGSNVG